MNEDQMRDYRPGYQRGLRERFSAWLCWPATEPVLSIVKSTRQIIEGYDKQIDAQQQEINGLKLLCKGLSQDLNSALEEIGKARQEQSEKPRVRVARNFSAFSEAATIAARKGANK